MSGNDVIATGHGTLAFNDTDPSGFWIHAEASHLESVNTMVNASGANAHPLSGIGTVDAVIGGNKKEFTVNGTATGNGLRYDEVRGPGRVNDVCGEDPELDAQRAVVTADSKATFVDVKGFEINELTAKTEYGDKNVKFDVTAKQPMRDLATQGSLVLHPDHNEVHLAQFKLTSQGTAWQTAEGHEPAIQWGNDLVIVKDLALEDAATKQQQMLANGTIGKAGENLTVELKNVNLNIIDAFLLRPTQLSGSANAKAVVTGTTAAPSVAADFSIANGKFRDVPWQSFSGKANYTPKAIVLDTKLEQNEMQWLTAKGGCRCRSSAGRRARRIASTSTSTAARSISASSRGSRRRSPA